MILVVVNHHIPSVVYCPQLQLFRNVIDGLCRDYFQRKKDASGPSCSPYTMNKIDLDSGSVGSGSAATFIVFLGDRFDGWTVRPMAVA